MGALVQPASAAVSPALITATVGADAAYILAERDRLYAILDAADDVHLHELFLQPDVVHQCLYHESVDPMLPIMAPYLVRVDLGLLAFIERELTSSSWGLFIESGLEISELTNHLRTLLVVDTPDGHWSLLRFYDPRVLPKLLSACDERELVDIFGPIEAFLAPLAAPRDQFVRLALRDVEAWPPEAIKRFREAKVAGNRRRLELRPEHIAATRNTMV